MTTKKTQVIFYAYCQSCNLHISYETGEQVCISEKLKVTAALGCGGFPLKKTAKAQLS